jgi:hypothetical protein
MLLLTLRRLDNLRRALSLVELLGYVLVAIVFQGDQADAFLHPEYFFYQCWDRR